METTREILANIGLLSNCILLGVSFGGIFLSIKTGKYFIINCLFFGFSIFCLLCRFIP